MFTVIINNTYRSCPDFYDVYRFLRKQIKDSGLHFSFCLIASDNIHCRYAIYHNSEIFGYLEEVL